MQGAPAGEESLFEQAKAWIKQEYDKPGNVYLGMVHRLDRPVSGVIVFARTSKSARRLSEQFRAHRVEKAYLAVVEGKMKGPKQLCHWLLRQQGWPAVVPPSTKGAQKATLSYSVTKEQANLTEISIKLGTGRKHQIRLQLSSEGHPIVGDKRYGAKTKMLGQKNAIALMAHRLVLDHPTKGERMTFQADPPPWWPLLDR